MVLAARRALVLVPLLAFCALGVACAAGDMSLDVGPAGSVTTQATANDAGTTTLDAGGTTSLPPPSTPSTPSSDDAGSSAPPAGDDAGTPPSDDAGTPPVEDSGAPPPHVVDSGSADPCPGYAPPTTKAGCYCDSSEHTCQANGCYNGYYCELSSNVADESCVKKPAGC